MAKKARQEKEVMEKVRSSRTAALDKENFSKVRQDVRHCWRKLGMLQLRMTNDLYLGSARLPDEQIKEQLVRARCELQEIIDAYLAGE